MPRDLKKVPILQVGGPAPAPPTLPVIRVVLLHTEAAVQDLCPGTVEDVESYFFLCWNLAYSWMIYANLF